MGFPINFHWFYTTYFVSGVAHRLARSFQDGGERGLQIGKGNLV